MERITITINEVFGYASLDRRWIEDHNFDYELFAAQNGWICDAGVLAVTFRLDINAPVVAFGRNPGTKILRRLAKEQKARQAILAVTKSFEDD